MPTISGTQIISLSVLGLMLAGTPGLAQQPTVRAARGTTKSTSVTQAPSQLRVRTAAASPAVEEVPPALTPFGHGMDPFSRESAWAGDPALLESAMGAPVPKVSEPIPCPRCGRAIRPHGLADHKEYSYREPSPFGVATRNYLNTQIANGEAELLVIRRGYFVEGSDELTPYGRQRLSRALPLLPRTPYPVVLEPTPHHPELDEARVVALQEALTTSPFPIPPERIVVGYGRSRGLDGVDAEIVHESLRLLMEARGTPPPPAYTPIGQ